MRRARFLTFFLFCFILMERSFANELEHWIHPFGIHVGQTSWQTLSAQFPDHNLSESGSEQFFHGISFTLPGWKRYQSYGLEFAPVADPVILMVLTDPDDIIQYASLSIQRKNPYVHAQNLIATHFPSAALDSIYDHSHSDQLLRKYSDGQLDTWLILQRRKFKTDEGEAYIVRWVQGMLKSLPENVSFTQYNNELPYSDQLPEDHLSLPWLEGSPNHGSSLILISPKYLRIFEESLRKKAETSETDENVRTMLREKLAEYDNS